MDVSRRAALLLLAGALVLGAAPLASASQLIDRDATNVRLQANARGQALLTYRARGGFHSVVASGAVNARAPSSSVPQVQFRKDYSGRTWATGGSCRRYDGPALAYLVAACNAPDGTYWSLQAWQPYLPHRGYPPWLPRQTQWELHVSHWSGPTAKLEAYTDWAFNGQAHDLFGRLTYLGNPVYGFGIGKDGAPNDRYGRSLYIDTLDSAYGPGWKRETSISFRRGSGAFCYSFWPTHDNTLPGYPNNLRPAGNGKRYRITVEGPGVTPDLQWEGAGLHDYNPNDNADRDYEAQMDKLFMQFLGQDKFCPTQR